MPRPATCESRAKCSRIGSANTDVTETGWKHIGDGQCHKTTAKCTLVTGCRWECVRVVGPEFHSGQIPEFTWLMQWPSCAPGRSSVCQRQIWEHQPRGRKHLGSQATSLCEPSLSLEAPSRCVEARWITVVPPEKTVLFVNSACVSGNHSYHLSFNGC